MKPTITPEQDLVHKKIIMNSFSSTILRRLTDEERDLLEHGTPEARAMYVKKQRRWMYIFCTFVVSLFTISQVMPHKLSTPLPSPAQTVISVGTVQGLQLHETAFSTSTSVVTTTGTYQVRGGVSAANGEVVSLRMTQSTLQGSELCIQSKIKAKCYALL